MPCEPRGPFWKGTAALLRSRSCSFADETNSPAPHAPEVPGAGAEHFQETGVHVEAGNEEVQWLSGRSVNISPKQASLPALLERESPPLVRVQSFRANAALDRTEAANRVLDRLRRHQREGALAERSGGEVFPGAQHGPVGEPALHAAGPESPRPGRHDYFHGHQCRKCVANLLPPGCWKLRGCAAKQTQRCYGAKTQRTAKSRFNAWFCRSFLERCLQK